MILEVADPPDVWSALGFAVDDGLCRVGDVCHRLGADGEGVVAWSLGAVDGLPARPRCGEYAAIHNPPHREQHVNGVVALDHLVIGTPDLGRTIAAIEAVGLDLRRTRDSDTYGAPMRQAFFKIGDVIIEVIGPQEKRGDGPARFYGLAWTVRDLDATADFLGDRLHAAKDAVQPGRMIATLDKSAGTTVRMAFMSA